MKIDFTGRIWGCSPNQRKKKTQNLMGFRKPRDQEQELKTLFGEIPEVGREGECIGLACIALARGSVGHLHRQST